MTADLKTAAISETPPAFWDRVARRYADMPIRNLASYEATLERVRAYLHPEHDVLELGCGTGTTALRLARAVTRYTASDTAPEMISIAREKCAASGLRNLDLRTVGLGNGSLRDQTYDVVLAFNLLHLLPDRAAAFSEVYDVLPKGGLFISKTPCLGGVFRVLQPLVAILRRVGKAPNIRFLSPKQLERDIQKAGFDIVETGTYPKRPPSRLIVAKKP